MKYHQLIVLLPCHSLEDFPLHHQGLDAEGLLACWTALWHPTLLAAADAAPTWQRASDPPQTLAEKLIVVPSICQSDLPYGFAERARSEAACFVEATTDRDLIVAQALDQLDAGYRIVAPALAGDFLALGYCFLQIQTLTRQMRYSSSLDEVHFNSQLLAGAKAAVQGDEETARSKLSACFDLLAEERDHYYAVEAFLLDLTLLNEKHLGSALRAELAGPVPVNLLLSGHLLAIMAQQEPATLAALKEALAAGKVGLLGGEECELPLPLLSCETVLAQMRRGGGCYAAALDRRVEIFGRHRYGMTPLLPAVLSKLGFRGVCHPTMEEGRYPESSQIKTRWEGFGGAAIDALAKSPLDAGKPETFLGLGSKLGNSMDRDHVATLWLAHWPGSARVGYEDLKRCARYGNALGRFMTLENYFRDTYVPGHKDRFDADKYRSPYLQQSVARGQPGSISASVHYWQRRATLESVQSLGTCLSVIGRPPVAESPDWAARIDRQLDCEDDEHLDEQLHALLAQRQGALAHALPRKNATAQAGCLLLNPCSFVRRIGVHLPGLSGLPAPVRPVYAVAEDSSSRHAVVDVPACGFVWITARAEGERSPENEPSLAEDRVSHAGYFVLRNEFFEARVHPQTGSLLGLLEYGSRDNRLSQQIACRLSSPRPRGARSTDSAAQYSTMAADSVRITRSTSVLGEIVTRGRLVGPQGQPLAAFIQTYRLWRGSRVVQLEIEIEPQLELSADPWESYFACRFAWADEAAELYRSLHQTRQKTETKRIESPHFLEIDSGEQRTAILTGGLPNHRRIGLRMLDSLLVVRGEQERRFRLGVGVDLAHPIHEAMGLLSPAAVFSELAAPPSPANSGWFFHLDAKNVVATHWSPLVEDTAAVGCRTRLLETRGRPTKTKLRCCCPLRSARTVDFLGTSLGDCRLEEGDAVVELAANEWVEIEARWA